MNKSEQLIACLEGEIAKRDEELAACRVAVENCELFRARIAELDERIVGLDAELCERAEEVEHALADLNNALAELAALKAQDFDPLVCDYCDAETQDPWHGSGMLNGAESHHIHACNQCRNLLPTTKAQGVVMPEGWIPLTIEHEPGYPEDVAFGPKRMMDRLKKWLDRYFEMRLNATPVHQVSVPASAFASRAITHYEAALLAAFPSGSSGEVFNQWNEARRVLAAAPAQQDQAFCEYCGGNDEEPQDHCMDCTRPVQQVSVPDETRSLAQRLREYNQNPHHINPMSEAFHILVADAANALSTACVPKEVASAITWSEHLLFECGALTSTRAPSVHVYNKTFAAVNEARAMIAAVPAAPAADASDVLEQAMYTLISIGYHENSGLVHELRQALAAHSAKGVV